jgi:hypothetical protein
MTMRPLTDREPIELAVPCVLWHGLVTAGCFGRDPNVSEEDAKAEIAVLVPKLTTLLATACKEPLDDLPPKKRRQLSARITRESVACSRDLDQQPAVKVALTFYHFTKALLEEGVLELWEGSAMGEAMDLLFPCFEHGFSEAALDASAQKQARRVLGHLQRGGFYQSAAALAA